MGLTERVACAGPTASQASAPQRLFGREADNQVRALPQALMFDLGGELESL